jgi:heme-degrading monooxygenase HmoA
MSGPPLARIWSGTVPPEHADSFLDHLLATGVAEAGSLNGCLGAIILRRSKAERELFTLLTFWRDESAVAEFARGNTAVHYIGDEAFGLIPDDSAVHYAVVYHNLQLSKAI